MVYCGSDCGGGGCHCGARGGHRHMLPQGPAQREGVQLEEEQASLWGSGEATGGRTRALFMNFR